MTSFKESQGSFWWKLFRDLSLILEVLKLKVCCQAQSFFLKQKVSFCYVFFLSKFQICDEVLSFALIYQPTNTRVFFRSAVSELGLHTKAIFFSTKFCFRIMMYKKVLRFCFVVGKKKKLNFYLALIKVLAWSYLLNLTKRVPTNYTYKKKKKVLQNLKSLLSSS